MSRPNVHGLPQYLRKDEKGYFLDYYVKEGGGRTRKRVRLGNIPLEKARRILAQHMLAIIEGELLAPKRHKVSFDEAADAFLDYSRSRKKSFRRDVQLVAHLKVFFGDCPLETLTLDRVEKYIVSRRSEKQQAGREIKGATLNREITCLKTIVRRAVLNRQLDRNPLEGIKLFKEHSRSRTLTSDEYERLLSKCSGHLRPIVQLAYVTAMRKGEILGLRWNQVDLQNKVIVLEAADTKTQEKREIPLDEGLLDLLKRVPRFLGSHYVFTQKGKPIGNIRKGFFGACERAGIKDFRFHDLRHCAVTNLRKAGVPDNVIMSISGHKTHAVFKRYDRVDRDDRQIALERLRLRDANKTLESQLIRHE
jgi:integrase